jgi:pimeloyl-ACP methyl ester carboxylesterase
VITRTAAILATAVAIVAGALALPSAHATTPFLGAAHGAAVHYSVQDSADGGAVHRIAGTVFHTACTASTVVLLQHGLSYMGDAWNVNGYSVVRALTDAGYDVVTIDKLGYRNSPLPDGRKINVAAYADIAHQVLRQLHRRYAHTVIGGHSAGGEESELEAGLYRDVDALLVLGYSHFPSPQILSDVGTGDDPRALTSPTGYEYFLGTPEHRATMFFSADADPAVVAADRTAAQLTPSGEMLSISPQPSRAVLSVGRAPVFLQLASLDRLFPASYIDEEALLFGTKVTKDVVPADGHTFMLHRNGRDASRRMAQWLRHQSGTPSCA